MFVDANLLARGVVALERMADALERIADNGTTLTSEEDT